MITLRELEMQAPIYLSDYPKEDNQTIQEVQNIEELRNSPVYLVKVPLRFGDELVYIQLWSLLDSTDLVLAGPKLWLQNGKRRFCVSDFELCALLIDQMEQYWAGGDCNEVLGEFAECLDAMLAEIPRMPTISHPTCKDQGELEITLKRVPIHRK